MKQQRFWLVAGALVVIANIALSAYQISRGATAVDVAVNVFIAVFCLICMGGLVYASRKYEAGINHLKAAGLTNAGIERVMKSKDVESALAEELKALEQSNAR